MIVIDASAMIELLLNTDLGSSVRQLVAGQRSNVPHLLDVEVAQVLRRFVRKSVVTREQAETAIRDLQSFAVRRHSHQALLGRVLELADNLTAYDACYVALAEALDAVLVTCDAKLIDVPGVVATVALAE